MGKSQDNMTIIHTAAVDSFPLLTTPPPTATLTLLGLSLSDPCCWRPSGGDICPSGPSCPHTEDSWSYVPTEQRCHARVQHIRSYHQTLSLGTLGDTHNHCWKSPTAIQGLLLGSPWCGKQARQFCLRQKPDPWRPLFLI